MMMMMMIAMLQSFKAVPASDTDPLWPWLGPSLAALQYDMYFRFMDGITFGRSGPYGDAWLAALRNRSGV